MTDVDALDVDVAVIGAGLMGAATAWQLARRGRSVALVEQYEIGHHYGSSHGTERIYRRAYPDPFYVGLTGRAEDAWRELEDETGTVLRRRTGGLDHGAGRQVEVIAARLAEAGADHELLPAGEASRRWPAFHFDGPVLFHPDAGTLDADATVAACSERARELGATVLARTRATSVRVSGDRAVVSTTGPTINAHRVVVAAGPWLPELSAELAGLAGVLPELAVTQQQVFHFARREATAELPIFVFKGDVQTYGLPSGADGGPGSNYKVATHDLGARTSAAGRDGVIDAVSRRTVIDFAQRHLPGLDPRPVAEYSCLYTTTSSEDFVLDRVGPVVVASPCSGHGAKFTPLIGALAADLADPRPVAGTVAEPLPRFSLAAHRRHPAGLPN